MNAKDKAMEKKAIQQRKELECLLKNPHLSGMDRFTTKKNLNTLGLIITELEKKRRR